MIETVVVRLRLFFAVELSIQMPFSNMAGFVSFALEKFGECDFRFPQVNLMVGGDPPPNAIPVRGATRKDGRPGGRTNGAGRITLGEFGSLLCEFIQVGGLDDGVTVASQVTPAQIVTQENYEIRLSFLRLSEDRER